MNNVREFDQELAESKSLIPDLKADRAPQREKEAREAWTKYTAISLVFIAVLAAIPTQWAGKYSGRVLVELNNATFNQEGLGPMGLLPGQVGEAEPLRSIS